MLTVFLHLTLLAFITLRLRTYLQPYQQEEYDGKRFLTWAVNKRAADRWASLGLVIALLFGFVQPEAPPFIAALWLFYRTYQEPNPTIGGKKPLALTTRAKQIWMLALLIDVSLQVAVYAFNIPPVIAAIALIQLQPLVLTLSGFVLSPIQAWHNQKYVVEANAILQRLKPTVVGLTGSFGKTSTKYILGHILNAHAPTLQTPGSINTPLGIARIVREQLLPQHQYFLAEMGAYGPGSIARLCKLAPPSISCITAVGEAHYERFKSLETVANAKFEIAEATFTQGGKCILSLDGIPENLWRSRVVAKPEGYRLVSSNSKHIRAGDYLIKKAEQTAQGLTLTVVHNEESTTFAAPIYGMAQVGNLATAFALAVELGLSKKSLAAAFAKAPAAPHRLNVRHEGTLTTIDDSYNANPTGFASALEVLSLIAGKKRRRVLVTPGMVELGAKHNEEHARLGKLAAEHADVILAVHSTRIPTFVEAAKTASTAEVVPLPTLAAARTWLAQNGKADDVLLIENDLPELYEARWVL